MFQVRFHGRGGQGVVTAAELLASAAFREDRHAQAFPSFGSERMGAPMMSFCRIDDQPIRTHEPVTEPDALIIQDPTLLHQAELFQGLGRDGYMLLNSTQNVADVSATWRSSGPRISSGTGGVAAHWRRSGRWSRRESTCWRRRGAGAVACGRRAPRSLG